MWSTLRHLAGIYRNPYLTRERLDALQAFRLNEIIRHAKATVPYYRQLLDGISLPPESGAREYDISTIPITRKKDLLRLDRKLIMSQAYNGRRLASVRTSGSSGPVLHIYFDDDLLGCRTASHHRAYIANGYKFWDKIANLQFRPVECNKYMTRIGLLRRYFVPFEMSVDKQIDILQSIKPTVLEGYPSRLVQVGRELTRRGTISFAPRLIISNSEKLNNGSKNEIRRAFGVEPINFYDSWEFGLIAWECPKHGGLHVNEDLLKVEIVSEDGTPLGPGEQGEVVITDLFNRAMPLIRYGTGDVAARRGVQCTCGRTFFLLDGISGRLTERLYFSDGTSVVATNAAASIVEDEFDEITDFQCYQKRLGELELRLLAGDRLSKGREEQLRSRFHQTFPLDKITIQYFVL